MDELLKEYYRAKKDLSIHRAALVASLGLTAGFAITQCWIAALFTLFAHRCVYSVYCNAKQFLLSVALEIERQERIDSLGGKK